MNKILKIISIALTVVIYSSNIAFAEPLTTSLENQKNEIQYSKDEIQKVQKEKQDLEIKIEEYDSQIEGLMRTIEDNKNSIEDMKNKIDQMNKDVAQLENEINKKQELFNERMRIMYINGTDGYINVIFSSDNMIDLISNIDTLIKINVYDKNVITNLNNDKVELKAKKDALEAESQKLTNLKAENEAKLVKLNESKNEQSALLENLKSKEAFFANYIDETQIQIQELLKQIQQGNNLQNSNNTSMGSYNFNSNSVIAFAAKFIGIPYLWGGTSPQTGFDCSGFVQYVYANFGIKLGRTTYDQIKNGYEVKREDLKPGDLILFGTAEDPHHIGMYIGNGAYIHAPQTGDVIKISLLSNRNDYLTARRVM